MSSFDDSHRIHVTASRTGWTVSVSNETHAVFVGERARGRAVEWALRLTESLWSQHPVVVVIDGMEAPSRARVHSRRVAS